VQSTADPTTILISIDGFRSDYVDRGATPVLASLAREGVRAAVKPSFPAVTLPNHFTLMTGLVPDRHGVVDSNFEDPELAGLSFRAGEPGAYDPRWWKGATPIWVTAEERGIRTAAMFWPSTGVDEANRPPRLFRPFDPDVQMAEEPNQVLAWLDLPEAERPRFLMLYFYFLEATARKYGPNSPEVSTRLAEIDWSIGRLVYGLKTRGLLSSTNLIITADHGVTEVSADRVIELDSLIDPGQIRLVSSGAYAAIYPSARGELATIESKLVRRHSHMECWKKGNVPARFRYGTHRRAPPVLCLADVGWTILTRAQRDTELKDVRGGYGYDPDSNDMAAIFIANGPAFRSGMTMTAFPNVDVYPLLTHLLGISAEPNDGDFRRVSGMLKTREAL
jgi:predicted AlkP superfamily pyrophosphatase or phosphodiesterase